MRLWVYAARRLVLAIPVVIGIMSVLFVLFSALPTPQTVCSYGIHPGQQTAPCTSEIPCPGNPSQLCPNPAYQSAVNALGLDQPIYVQWFIFIANTVTFHWGYVTQTSALGIGATGTGLPVLAGQPVSVLMSQFLPYSVELLLLALLFTVLIVVPIRIRAKVNPGGPADRLAHALTLPGYGIPLFIVAILALFGCIAALGGPGASSPICGSHATVLLDFYGSWPIGGCTSLYGTTGLGPLGYPAWLLHQYRSTPTGFPTIDAALHGAGWLALDTILRMVLPALGLAFVAVAVVLRHIRFTPIERERVDHLRAVRGQGLPALDGTRRIARRSALADVASGLGPAFAMMLAMLPVVEVIFNLWGIGSLFVLSGATGTNLVDPGVLLGTLLTFALLGFAVNLMADVIRAYLDPRTRLEERRPRPMTLPDSAGPRPKPDPTMWV